MLLPSRLSRDINNDLALHKKFLDFFVSRIEFLDKGWVDVIPYNDNLVFLKGEMVNMILYIKIREVNFLNTKYIPHF